MSAIASHHVEPIPGYVLRERLGGGGYGEVWKADAPGGLSKAVKLVYGLLDEERASNELKALQRIKDLRHPFLLSLERIEIVDGRLIIVTELADSSLKDRFEQCLAGGNAGVPRRELLQYMRDAADALDCMNNIHSLQHLDVKPENLLLVGEHVKVADFGLVKDMHQDHSMSMLAGMTPIYAAPELFEGTPSRRSDQYSLAIVYQYMLTGELPFPGRNANQLANQHLHARPMLDSLPQGDRKVIARALAKDPQQRFASCRDMVEHLCDDSLRATLPHPDSWFAQNAPIDGSAKKQLSSDCLGSTGDCTNPLSAMSDEVSAAADVETRCESNHEAVRNCSDMFDTLEGADKRCSTDYVETMELRSGQEPVLRYRNVPAVTGEYQLVPTVFVGVGRAAGIVLQQLKQRMSLSAGKTVSPLVDFILLDSDSQDLQRALRGDDGTPLDATEALHIGLRKSQEYRNEGPALSHWLSRRWLFNIPRSQKPEGLRPLGRLAFVDHARDIHQRFKKSIQRITSEECRAEGRLLYQKAISPAPRIVIIGAIGGGTASGMMLDLGILARQKLEKLGFEQHNVTGIMLHYLNRTPATHELAMVNSYTTLSELSYYVNSKSEFPGDATCGLEPQSAGQAPFTHPYLISFKEYLSDEHLTQQMKSVSDYLFLNTFTACRELFTPPTHTTNGASTSDYALRSFGLHRVGIGSSPMLPMASAVLCNDLMQMWLGESKIAQQKMSQIIDPVATKFFAVRKWEAPELLSNLQTAWQQLMPDTVESLLGELVPANFKQTSSELGDISVALEKVKAVLGICDENGLGASDKWPLLLNNLARFADEFADREANVANQFVADILNQCGARAWGAQQLWQLFNTQLSTLQNNARTERCQLFNLCQSLEQKLGAGLDWEAQKKQPLRKNAREYLALFAQYLQSRVQFVNHCFTESIARRIKAQMAKLGERLQDLRRDLKNLSTDVQAMITSNVKINETDKPLGDLILERFETQRESLLIKLEAELQSSTFTDQPGFYAVITRGGAERLQLLSQLSHVARSLLMESLQTTDLFSFLLSDDPATNQPRYHDAIKRMTPHVLADANAQIFVSMNNTTEMQNQSQVLLHAIEHVTESVPGAVSCQEPDITMLTECSGASLTDSAMRLVDFRNDLMDYATRVFSRGDIPFQPLSNKRL
jgi:eukaryotic-like serine/threonine-protein kinase